VVDEVGSLVIDEDVFSDVSRLLDQVKDIYTSAEDSLRVSHQVEINFTLFLSKLMLKGVTAAKHNVLFFQYQRYFWRQH
jgi:hypothetical protein